MAREPEATIDALEREEFAHAQAQVEAAQAGDAEAVVAREREHARVQQEAAQRLRDYERILALGQGSLDAREIVEDTLARTRSLLRVDAAIVLFLDASGQRLVLEACQGFEHPERLPDAFPASEWFSGRVLTSRRPLALRGANLHRVAHPVVVEEEFQSLMGVPLFLEGRAIGVLTVAARRPLDFGPREVHLLQIISDRLALAVDRARLVERERRRREDAEQTSSYQTDLFRMATHDLRSPLTALMLQAYLLREGGLTGEEARRAVEVLERNLQRLDLMLSDFLDLSRLEAGRFVLHRAPFDLACAIREVVETLAPKAAERRIAVEARTPESLSVVGHERRLVQVLHNLLGNALRYSFEGGRVTVEALVNAGVTEVTIRDAGMGLSADQIGRLFRPSSQVQGGAAERHGSGLGLYITRRVIEEHGGSLEVQSPGRGAGTLVRFRLPGGMDLEPTDGTAGEGRPE